MSIVRQLVVTIILLIGPLAGLALGDTARVTFILVNDIYLMSDQMMADGNRRGGFARLAAVVKAERAKGGHMILAHAGDTLSPSLMSGIDRGAHIMALTNLVAPDIFVPGNHEFDFGKTTFLQRMAEARFPLFAANLRGANGQPLTGFNDRAIRNIDGIRIGLTGATYDESAKVSSPEDLKFLPTVATMKEQAEALRREGADFVVAVVHADREQDNAIFASRTVDLVLSGHNHDLLINFDGRNAVVESSYDALYVTAIDIVIEAKQEAGQRVVNWWPQFRVIDTATVTPDAQVAAVVAEYEQELSRKLDAPIAMTAIELDSREAAVRTGEAPIGDLIADAMRAGARADVAITNGGSIRGGKIYAPGAMLTRRDIIAEMPFNNRLVLVEIRGAELRRALENGLSRWPAASGRFPQVSGLKIQADRSRPAGQRIVSLTVGDAPLDETKMYRVATNDFMARGGDGYTAFADAEQLLPADDSPLIANAVISYLENLGVVRSVTGDRMILK